ncbi:MAG: nucleotidyl transferase AbiEii/AbiGii toxin family protein [Candidatus Margulisiibacteriota bacterium]|nr:nucleotidyl transferase AbiEii/AbiGii toxin family protein [Candidatus Margulisiibacteriota bacterium]
MSLDTATHKNILLRILKDIYTDTSIGPFLGFKGGTAAYFLYGLERFSVDLDFDLLDETKEKHIFEQVKKILADYGTVKEAREKRYNLFYLLSYTDKVQGARNIKVEINRRNFGSKYEVKTHLGISMKVMVKEDMAAHKLVAMSERIGKTNRDIFDVCFFLQHNWPVNKEIVEKRARISFKDFLRKCIHLLEKTSNRNILSGIGELVNDKQKAWVKSKLRMETIFLLKLKLDNKNQ